MFVEPLLKETLVSVSVVMLGSKPVCFIALRGVAFSVFFFYNGKSVRVYNY